MRFIEENLGNGPKEPSFNRRKLLKLQEWVADLAGLYQDLGLQPHQAWRSALADFAGDFPGEVAMLHQVRSEG